MKVETVGVIGAGVMGVGVAHSLALANFRVRLVDVTEEKLAAARELIRQNIRLQNMMKRGNGMGADAALENIKCSTKYEILSDVDFAVENVIENRSEERRVGKECRSRWSP